MTKDEKFLLEIYLFKKRGDSPTDPKEIGKKLGYTDHQIKNIVQGLAQANLVKKIDDQIEITELGENLAEEFK